MRPSRTQEKTQSIQTTHQSKHQLRSILATNRKPNLPPIKQTSNARKHQPNQPTLQPKHQSSSHQNNTARYQNTERYSNTNHPNLNTKRPHNRHPSHQDRRTTPPNQHHHHIKHTARQQQSRTAQKTLPTARSPLMLD